MRTINDCNAQRYSIRINNQWRICFKIGNVYPVEILSEENNILLERQGITADTALKLAKFFDATPKYWMNYTYLMSFALPRMHKNIKCYN